METACQTTEFFGCLMSITNKAYDDDGNDDDDDSVVNTFLCNIVIFYT